MLQFHEHTYRQLFADKHNKKQKYLIILKYKHYRVVFILMI